MADDPNELIERLNDLEKRKNPAPNSILKYFAYGHLPTHLQYVSQQFYVVAEWLADLDVADEAERRVALRKLLEAKDAAVRCVIEED